MHAINTPVKTAPANVTIDGHVAKPGDFVHVPHVMWPTRETQQLQVLADGVTAMHAFSGAKYPVAKTYRDRHTLWLIQNRL